MATFDVLLPVKNGIDYLAESLDSICQQTYRDWRLFVLDHGSNDGSRELAELYAERDSRISVHSLPYAHGLSGLLNLGLELCDSKYVLRQDADDVSLPNRLQVLANAFEFDHELALVGSLGDVVDAEGRSIGMLDMPTGRYGVLVSTLFRTPVAHPTVAMRLDKINALGARYGEDFIGAIPESRRMHVPGLAEDYFMFGQLALVSRCMNIGQRLIRYRWHGANIGATRYVAQTQLALNISRYLTESLSIMLGINSFDPAPFCNHGMNLINFYGREDFSEEYGHLRRFMTRAMPQSAELSRELSFRKVVSSRSRLVMASRYLAHTQRYGVSHLEWRTVRSWLINDFKKQPILTLTPAGLVA
ncbi:Putative glycosyltransferase EpsE [Methylophilaceae bacterium]|nr:Putative glycosyltransferase EpsE [Methylophilaceae bacterium]